MAFTVQNHLSQMFEMGKKAMPVYFKLMLILLAYMLGFILFAIAGKLFAFSNVLLFVHIVLMIVALIYLIVISVRSKVAFIQAIGSIEKGGTDAKTIWNNAKGNFWKKTVLDFAYGVFVFIGFLFFIIPGILVLVMGSFCYFAAFLRGKKVMESLKYSRAVAKGHFWMIVGRAIVALFIVFILFLPASIFQNKLGNQVGKQFPQFEKMADSNGQVTDEGVTEFNNFINSDEGKAQLKDAISGMVLPIFVYIFYSLAIGLLMLSFGYPYWYILFKELEQVNKVK